MRITVLSIVCAAIMLLCCAGCKKASSTRNVMPGGSATGPASTAPTTPATSANPTSSAGQVPTDADLKRFGMTRSQYEEGNRKYNERQNK